MIGETFYKNKNYKTFFFLTDTLKQKTLDNWYQDLYLLHNDGTIRFHTIPKTNVLDVI